jgi:putative aldouronate transport system permease protein
LRQSVPFKRSLRTRSLADISISSISYLSVVFFALLCVLPFALLVAGSFSEEVSLLRYGYRLVPRRFSIEAYSFILSNNVVFNSYRITILVTVIGTFLSILLTSGLAYSLSLPDLKYQNAISLFVYVTMLFSGGLVPYYILIAKYLDLKDKIWVLIVPLLVNPWNMFLLRNYFRYLPVSLAESARIDGANDIFILIRIVIPLSTPAIATIGLFYAIAYWNEWFLAVLFVDDKKLYPLQYLLIQIQKSITFYASGIAEDYGLASAATKVMPSYSSRMATACITIGPVVLLYPFVQKFFVRGLVLGAIKG